ncbi:MAG: phage holin family protein [Desulfobacteraceae bacterium]|nr:phage holin family protein [Desulfobacteraceae bacterium]
MFSFLLNIIVLSVAVFLVSNFLPGIRIKNFMTALVVALVYSIINFFIGWLLVLITLPFMLITFGLFKFIINTFLLWVTDKIIDDFEIKDVLTTFIAAFLITIVDSLIKWVL